MKFIASMVALLCLAMPVLAQTPAGDASKGKKLYETLCAICHSLTENRIGPSHKGIFGRKAGTVAGFNYSAGFAKLDVVWNEKTLDTWIANPEGMVAGQKMGFYVMEAETRADVIAYLKSVASAPK
jgi:cytochrome c